jgi:hypothetical protein
MNDEIKCTVEEKWNVVWRRRGMKLSLSLKGNEIKFKDEK